ncbi:hypothetical protein M408DRAFT_328067 [Serendipita vermifera MAFF 305830]|uniref:Uncharacterized protein n=1 Tax=Serendipita vermifera MAFF 305830 TaxID=933852 RepID=A0A0C3B142_SERVB|nr:hypothetical protein M408DRAFT_328067 [Serendipita vermifera MAFF 305830]
MSTFLALRYVAFALFILLSGLTGSFAGLNFGFMTSGVVVPQDPIKALDMYLVVISALNVLFVVPIIGTELYRKGALTSRIWFELFWVSAFFLAYLGGAIAATMLIPNAVCKAAGSMKLACMTSTILIAFTWITSALYLIYSFSLLAYCIIHSKPNFNIWNTTIVDHPWTPKPLPNLRSETQSIDSRQTLTDAHVVPYKGFAHDDSPIHEKDVLPVFSRNNGTMAGPTTFGGAANNQRMGVNAINGAPAYSQPADLNGQGPHKFYSNPQRDLESGNAEGHRQAPWSQDDETPSPAVITHASRVQQPSLSLYPVHVVNAGLTTQSAHPGTKPRPLEDLLKAAGLNHSATSLPYMKTSVGHGQEADVTSKTSSPIAHSKSQSFDSVIQAYSTPRGAVKPSAGGRKSQSEERGGRRSRPRHRPPPLDLSSLGLSNIANADRR